MTEKFVQIWYKPAKVYNGLDIQIDKKDFGRGAYSFGKFHFDRKTFFKGWDKFEDVFRRLYLKSAKNGGIEARLLGIGISREENEFIHERFRKLYENLKEDSQN